MTNRTTFLKLLREDILKLDLADLDFGIYRVLNYRLDEIERFLNERLPALMSAAFSGSARDRLADVRRNIEDLRKVLDGSAQGMGLASAFQEGRVLDFLKGTPNGQRFEQLLEEQQLLEARAGFSQSEEDELYNRLYVFFSRYYRDGDFMTQPRRGRKAHYSVAYNGDDVHFHWKSRGSHYVKTTEELRSYVCVINGWRVRFELHAATEEKDNVKGAARFFIPLPKKVVTNAPDHTLLLPFEFRPLTKAEATKYDGKAKRGNGENGGENGDTGTTQERILADRLDELRPKLPADLPAAELARQVRRYARKNRADYFVHHGLADFLTDEFAYYLKSEFLDLDALTTPEALSDAHLKLKALRQVGAEIIALLDQIESFQAHLFEKRKFVLRADYLLPIRLVPREIWPAVLANLAQLAAWRDLFGLEGEIDEQTLQSRPTLVVDTRHFDAALTRQVLASFEDIDGSTDGLLINAENYAALTTLAPSYAGRVKVIYIDPPYNTGGDGFLYKDDFARHSTWLSMMEERLRLAHDMLGEDGVIFVSIDDHELVHLRKLMDQIFGADNCIAAMVWKGATDNNPTRIAIEHEYLLCYARNIEHVPPVWENPNDSAKHIMLEKYEEIKQQTTNVQEIQQRFRRFIRDNRESLQPLTHYDRIDIDGPYTGGRKVHNPGKEGYRYSIIHPVTQKEVKQPARGYRFPKTTMDELLAADKIIFGDDEDQIIQIKEYLKDYVGSLKGVIELDSRVGANMLEALFGSRELFRNPKPVELLEQLLSFTTDNGNLVLDFFAGSGTTGHAVLSLNFADGKRRKFLLADMGEYFDTVLVPRVQKLMYAQEWSQGMPTSSTTVPPLLAATMSNEDYPDWVKNAPRLVKLLRLESYEDSLNALELPQERTARMLGQLALFGTTYLIKYMLPAETDESPVLVNTQRFEDPFAYRLDIHTPAGVQETPVDLIETFNLLMGLHVRSFRTLDDNGRHYVLVDALEEGRPVLVVWRDAIPSLDPEHERAWLSDQLDLSQYTTVYTNADSALPNGRSLDSLFKQRMVEPGRRTLP